MVDDGNGLDGSSVFSRVGGVGGKFLGVSHVGGGLVCGM